MPMPVISQAIQRQLRSTATVCSARTPAQGVDDGNEPIALRCRRVEQPVARRRFGELAQFHQGAHVLATRQTVLARAMTEEQAEHLALAQQCAELGGGDVDQEAVEEPDLDSGKTPPRELIDSRAEGQRKASVVDREMD